MCLAHLCFDFPEYSTEDTEEPSRNEHGLIVRARLVRVCIDQCVDDGNEDLGRRRLGEDTE